MLLELNAAKGEAGFAGFIALVTFAISVTSIVKHCGRDKI
jgi:hypothetical protein